MIDKSPSVYLIHMENLIAGKDSVTGEGGALVTQESMADADAAKIDAD